MTSQHDRDSRELRELCAQRDAARATVRQQAERIAELEKEGASLKEVMSFGAWSEYLACKAERDQLRAEVERYHHLRNGQSWPAVFASHDAPEPLRGEDLDAAIDQARTTHKDEG